MRRIPLVLSLLALCLALFVLLRPADAVPVHTATGVPTSFPTEEVEVAVHMGRIQRYHQKWWAAGKQGNAELAAFYLHEMAEAMELIAQARIMDEGIDISAHMNTYGSKTVRDLEAVLLAEGVSAMHAQGAALVAACNSCHAVTGHPFIRIQEPAIVGFPDQDFAPIRK